MDEDTIKSNRFKKKTKLPKIFWTKGKSKFLFMRLYQEGMTHISELYKKYKIKKIQ